MAVGEGGERGLEVVAPGGPGPFVEDFVPDEEAKLVAEFEELFGAGVMGEADGVDAHFHHDFELAAGGAGVEGAADGAEVVVEVDAVELDAAPVEMEAVVGGEGEGAEAEFFGEGVELLAVGAEEADLGGVEAGGIGVPELRLVDVEGDLAVGGGAGDGLGRDGLGGDGGAVGGEECGLYGDGLVGGEVVFDFDFEGGVLGGEAEAFVSVGLDGESPVGEVDGLLDGEFDFAVESGAGVPAGGPLGGVEADGEDVGLAEAGLGGEVDAEGGVAVVPRADFDSVEVDGREGHGAVEVEVGAGAVRGGWEVELVAVPTDAFPGELAGAAVGGGIEGAGGGPVVGDVDGLAGEGIGVEGGGGRGEVARVEEPAVLEGLTEGKRGESEGEDSGGEADGAGEKGGHVERCFNVKSWGERI